MGLAQGKDDQDADSSRFGAPTEVVRFEAPRPQRTGRPRIAPEDHTEPTPLARQVAQPRESRDTPTDDLAETVTPGRVEAFTLDPHTLPSDIRDLLDNVTIHGPAGRAASVLPGAPRNLGPYILFGALGEDLEHALEIRRVAAPRRCVVRRCSSASPGARERFVEEARAGRAIDHPNVVKIYDAGEDAGAPYLVREFVDGKSAAQLLANARGNGLPVELVAAIGAQIGSALVHAHDHGMVHGEIAPSSILIAKTGQAKLTELGLPGVAEPRRGKPGCAAPEQSRGEKIDRRTDVYSLGTALLMMLERRAAPDGLRRTLARATALAPADRPSSAGELAAALYEILEELAPNLQPDAAVVRALRDLEQEREQAELPATVPPMPRPPPPGSAPMRMRSSVTQEARALITRQWILLVALFVLGLLIGALSWYLI